MKKIILLIAVALSLSSCAVFQLFGADPGRSYYDSYMHYPIRSARQFVDSTGREVILVPMIEMAEANHLAAMRIYLNQKKADGFVVFYESVDTVNLSEGESFNSMELDTLRRKFRRVTRVDLSREPSSYTKHVSARDCRNWYSLNAWRDSLGLTTSRDVAVDMSLSQLINHYETNHKPIVLTANDYEIPLTSSKYSPLDTVAHHSYYINFAPRTARVAQKIEQSGERKIILLYSRDLSGYLTEHIFRLGYTPNYGFSAVKM